MYRRSRTEEHPGTVYIRPNWDQPEAGVPHRKHSGHNARYLMAVSTRSGYGGTAPLQHLRMRLAERPEKVWRTAIVGESFVFLCVE